MSNLGLVLDSVMNFIANPTTMLIIFAGTFMGLTFGSIPGLNSVTGITILIPLSYTLPSDVAIGMLLALYVGAMAGGAVSSILLGIPGTPSAVVPTFDGYPMCQQGRGAEAMGWAAVASTFGSIFSWLALVLVSVPLAVLTTSFSAPEYAALALLGLTIVGSITGKSAVKGLTMAAFGFFITCIGVDPLYGDFRFTFGVKNLMGGINMMPIMLGVYTVPQMLSLCNQKNTIKQINVELKNFIPSLKKIWAAKKPLLVTSIIGTIVGIIPATGANVAQFLSYDQCRRMSKSPETFGKGNYEGVIASEAANNSVIGGAMVPLLTLGIPGDSVTAVILGGLMLHGVRPGPKLFVETPDFVIGVFTAMLLATIMMLFIQFVGIKYFIKILSLPNNYLVASLLVIMMIGSFTVKYNFFDIILALVFGTVGYFLTKAEYPMAPLVLGLVLGALFEREMRTAMRMRWNDWTIFFTRPASCAIIILSVVIVIYGLLKPYLSKRRHARGHM